MAGVHRYPDNELPKYKVANKGDFILSIFIYHEFTKTSHYSKQTSLYGKVLSNVDQFSSPDQILNWFCTMQGTQKEYPVEVLPFYTKKQKSRRQEDKKQKLFISNDLKVTGQSTHKIEPGNAFQMKGTLTKKE